MRTFRWLSFVLLATPFSPAFATDRQVSAGGSIATTLASAVSGDRLLVEKGTYFEHVTLKNGVQLRGGYDATFSEATRNPVSNRTVIHGSQTGPAITSGSLVGSNTIVDGFVLTGGGGTPGAGVLIVGGSPVFSNNEISGNRRAGIAGGVYVHTGSSARFDTNTFRDNSSAGSGGALRIESSPVVVVNNLFEANVAPHSGGALYVFASAVACTANTFRANNAGEGGGGVYVQHASGVVFASNVFENDRAPYGGGILMRDDAVVSLVDNDFIDCQATLGGGGIGGFNFAQITATDCNFDGCSSLGGGGGIWTHHCSVTLQGVEATVSTPTSIFRDCTAVGGGGGASLQSSTGTVQAVRFVDCTSDSLGGGVYALNSSMVIRRNVIQTCSAPEGGGLGIHSSINPTARSQVVTNTIYGCRATGPDNPGAVGFVGFPQTDQAEFVGNIVAFTPEGCCIRSRNLPDQGEFGTPNPVIGCSTIFRSPGNLAPLIVGDGGVNQWTSGNNNQPPGTVSGEGTDPKFCQAPPVDYTLQSCSPAVDTITCFPLVKENRGAAPDNTECACGIIVSLEADSWGRIKAHYR